MQHTNVHCDSLNNMKTIDKYFTAYVDENMHINNTECVPETLTIKINDNVEDVVEFNNIGIATSNDEPLNQYAEFYYYDSSMFKDQYLVVKSGHDVYYEDKKHAIFGVY